MACFILYQINLSSVPLHTFTNLRGNHSTSWMGNNTSSHTKLSKQFVSMGKAKP